MNCEFDENGKCINCGFIVPNYDHNVSTIRLCKKEKIFRKYPEMALFKFKGNPVPIKGLYSGCSIFYIGSGPSLVDEEALLNRINNERGLLSFAVNNAGASLIRPDLWTCVDLPKSFSEVIWNDPYITKFVPESKANQTFFCNFQTPQQKLDGTLVYNLPNTYTFELNSHFNHKTFLTENSVNWGTEKHLRCSVGRKGGRTVMFSAIKIMYYLGFKNIFLLGCDFNMQEKQPYAFQQKKWHGGCKTNNDCFHIMNERFTALQPKLLENECNIFNCTPNSNLKAFPNISSSDALKLALKNFPSDYSIKNMYV